MPFWGKSKHQRMDSADATNEVLPNEQAGVKVVVANLDTEGKELGITVDNSNVITAIEVHSAAACHGALMRGDTIVQLNGKQIEPTDDAQKALAECKEQHLTIIAARSKKEGMFQGRQRGITEGSEGSGRDSRNHQSGNASGAASPPPVVSPADNDGSGAMADLKLR